MKCSCCKAYLSLDFVEKEDQRGLGSYLHIRCHECLFMNLVATGNKHRGKSGKFDLFNINTKAVAGTLHSGGGETHLNKWAALLNLPIMSSQTFKNHEREIGLVAEKVADASCRDAADIERALTIQNIETLENYLPENLDRSFLLPSSCSTPLAQPSNAPPESAALSLSPHTPKRRKCLSESAAEEVIDDPDPTVTFGDVVRIMACYDMGYSTRGNGRSYDSLNGYAALIGPFSGKVLDYGTRNRKCRLCDMGRAPDDHDCRLNFQGSAKAMEADCAADLCNSSKILAERNLQVGLFVADDDASHIAKVREGSAHAVVKLSDRNHTTRGVDRILYGLEKSYKEVSREGVHYLHRCFTYALSQNKGNVPVMAAAIKNIPDHVYNKHDNCGDWCGFQRDKENYDHSTIPGGFKDPKLYEELKNVFSKLANNTAKFAHCASSQANESLNNTMASKAPKSRCYSTSESADFRFAFSVANKNLGESYISKFFENEDLQKAGMTPVSARTKKHLEVKQAKAMRRKFLSQTRDRKLNRVLLKKKKAALRKKKESKETDVYESAMGLLSQPVFESVNVDDPSVLKIVFYDLETSSLARNCDILQLAAKCGDVSFETFINPVQKNSVSFTKVNHMTNVDGELYRRGQHLPSVPLRAALGKFHQFLCGLGGPCVLVAHNGTSFDSVRLVYAIKSCQLVDEFNEVINSFADTLPMIRKKLNRPNKCSQTHLASEFLQITSDDAHDAAKDVEVLQKLCAHFEFDQSHFIDQSFSLAAAVNRNAKAEEIATITATLTPLRSVLSVAMIGRLAAEGLTFDKLVDTYTYASDQESGIHDLFTEEVRGAPRITKSTKIINDTQVYLESYFQIITAG